jgi:autotransporter-associated beta strand protein
VGQGSVATDSYSYAGALTDGTGQLSLTKVGLGIQALGGTSTYTGLTLVGEGRLLVNGTISSSSVSVSGTGVLGGTGTVTGNVAVGLGGTVAPGASTGTLTAGSCSIEGALEIELDGTSADRLTVTGELDIANATLVVATPGSGATETAYIIASYGTLVGTEFLTVSGLPDGYSINYHYQNSNQIALVSSATPYQLWAQSKGLDGTNNSPTADPDQDGISNRDEYAFDGDPLSGATSGKVVGAIRQVDSNRVLTLTLPVRTGAVFTGDGDLVSDPIGGVTYKIQGSTTLSDFTTMNVTEVIPAITTNLPPLSSGQWTYRTFRVPAPVSGVPKQFLRATVE